MMGPLSLLLEVIDYLPRLMAAMFAGWGGECVECMDVREVQLEDLRIAGIGLKSPTVFTNCQNQKSDCFNKNSPSHHKFRTQTFTSCVIGQSLEEPFFKRVYVCTIMLHRTPSVNKEYEHCEPCFVRSKHNYHQ